MARVVEARRVSAWVLLWCFVFVLGCGMPPIRPSEDVPANDGNPLVVDVTSDGASDGSSDAMAVDANDEPSEDASMIDSAPTDAVEDVPVANEACDRPLRVSPGTTLTNVSTAGATVTTVACLADFRGGLRFYSVDVPAGQVLEVSATAVGSMSPVAVRVFENCDGMCLNAAANVAQWQNRALSQRTVIVAIGGQGAAPITFDASFVARSAMLGESCVAPIDVTASTTIRVDGVSAAQRSAVCGGELQRARWFRVNIPSGFELSSRMTGGATGTIRVADSCAAATCIASGSGSVVLPRSMSDRTVLVSASPTSDMGFSVEFELNAVPVPGVCASSAVYRTSTTLNGESLSRAMESATNCAGASTPSVFYRVFIPAGQRLTASSSTFEVLLRVLNTCGASSCLATQSASSPIPRTRYVNETSSDQTVVVAVSARFPSPTTMYNLTLTLDTPSPAAACGTAPTVMPGSSVSIAWDEATNVATRCGTSGTIRSLFYAADVPAGRRLVVTGQRDTIVSILDGCGSSTCLGTRWPTDGLSTSTSAAWTNNTASTRRVIVTLANYFDSSSSYTLGASFAINMTAPQATCATAPLIANGETVAGASTQLSDQTFTPCDGGGPTPALWWRVTVPAGQRLVASLQPSASTFGSYGLAVISACGAVSCLASVPVISITGPRVVGWTNAGADSRTVYLAAFGSVSPFDISVSIAPPVAHATCAQRLALTSGVVQAGQRFVDAGEGATSCTSGVATPALFYEVTVPSGQRVDVTVVGTGGTHFTRILPACGAVSCLASSGSLSSMTSVTRWLNTDSSPRSVVIAVSRESNSGQQGAFDITASIIAPPANARCSTPTALSSGVTVSGSTENVGDNASTCGGTPNRALFYSVRVPAGQRLLARTSSTSTENAFVRILTACDAVACFGTSQPFDGIAYWTNTSSVAQDVLVAVGPRYSTTATANFSLTINLETPATNGTCSRAAVVTPSTTLFNERLIDASDTTTCGSSRAALYYAVTIPANRRLNVRATSRTASSVTTSIESTCRGTCFTSNESFRGPAHWTNASASAQDVIVAVGAFSSSSLATATVDVEFTLQTIPEAGSCAGAPALSPGAARTVSWVDASEAALTCGGPAQPLPTLFYTVNVPAGQNLTATLTGSSLFSTGVRILSSCAAPTCLASWRSSSTPLSTSWRNTGASTATAIIAVSVIAGYSPPEPSLLTASLSP